MTAEKIERSENTSTSMTNVESLSHFTKLETYELSSVIESVEGKKHKVHYLLEVKHSNGFTITTEWFSSKQDARNWVMRYWEENGMGGTREL